MTREQLRELARTRLTEAETLFRADLYEGCVYLCGYVVELALKARICTVLGLNEYPEEMPQTFRTHNFDHLRLLAGLKHEIVLGNEPLFNNWSLATRWKPESRYNPVGTYDRTRAEEILEAVRGSPDGVFIWLQQRW